MPVTATMYTTRLHVGEAGAVGKMSVCLTGGGIVFLFPGITMTVMSYGSSTWESNTFDNMKTFASSALALGSMMIVAGITCCFIAKMKIKNARRRTGQDPSVGPVVFGPAPAGTQVVYSQPQPAHQPLQAHPPPGGYTPAGGYQPAGGYPPQGYPPPAPGYPPPAQGYPPPAQGYPPPAQGYPPPTQGYPPPAQGYPPPAQGSRRPGQSNHRPAKRNPPPAKGYPKGSRFATQPSAPAPHYPEYPTGAAPLAPPSYESATRIS